MSHTFIHPITHSQQDFSMALEILNPTVISIVLTMQRYLVLACFSRTVNTYYK